MDLLVSAASTILGSPGDASSPPATAESSSTNQPQFVNIIRRNRRITYEDLTQTLKDLHDTTDPRVNRLLGVMNRTLRGFAIREFFYSAIDADYYADNEFIGCLQMLGLDHLTSLTRFEWSVVRGVMGAEIGRPRRFSHAFLESERMKLSTYRMMKRQRLGMSASVSVGDTVNVHDVKSRTLSKGLVLSTVESRQVKPRSSNPDPLFHEIKDCFLIQLDRPEMGIEVYEDLYINVVESTVAASNAFDETHQLNLSHPHPPVRTSSLSSHVYSSDESSETGMSSPTSQSNDGDEHDRDHDRLVRSTSRTRFASEDTDDDKSHNTNETNSEPGERKRERDGDGDENEMSEEKKVETLKRCAAAVQQVWPGCLAEAEKILNENLEEANIVPSADCENKKRKMNLAENAIEKEQEEEESRDITGGDSKYIIPPEKRELMVRCLAGLLLLRDARGKWVPKYAEPVLVAVASAICEGCEVQDYREVMRSIGDLLTRV